MYRIKIMDDPKEPKLREMLLLEMVRQFRPELVGQQLAVCRTEKGKPYVIMASDGGTGRMIDGLHFSVSHSGDLWSCLMADRPCGLDLQELRPCNYEKLAARFYTPVEQAYVTTAARDAGKTGSLQAFYKIWTRREALAKYTGLGFFGMGADRPPLVSEDGKLLDSVEWNGRQVWFEEMEAPEEFLSVWCYEGDKL